MCLNSVPAPEAADSGSVYEPHPILSFEWDPEQSAKLRKAHNGASFDLGPHPADPYSTNTLNGLPANENGEATRGPNARTEQVPAHEIWVYATHTGQVLVSSCLPSSILIERFRTSTFWRFSIEIPLGPTEMAISYSINNGQATVFYVPGLNQNMRWAAYSVSQLHQSSTARSISYFTVQWSLGRSEP
jgi:hypothetical protein